MINKKDKYLLPKKNIINRSSFKRGDIKKAVYKDFIKSF